MPFLLVGKKIASSSGFHPNRFIKSPCLRCSKPLLPLLTVLPLLAVHVPCATTPSGTNGRARRGYCAGDLANYLAQLHPVESDQRPVNKPKDMYVGERKSQDQLVDHLIRKKVVSNPRVVSVLRAVDRKSFINPSTAEDLEAYQDNPLPIGWGQTISAPHMHGVCLELLEPYLQRGDRALDVGSGSGYLTACMAKLVGPEGFILGVEKVPDIAMMSIRNIKTAQPDLLESRSVRIVPENALADVLEREEPFSAIHVGAAADEIPDLLTRKLAPGGRMVIPVGPRWSRQVLTLVDKDEDGQLRMRELMDVGYVPLTRPSEMEDGYMP